MRIINKLEQRKQELEDLLEQEALYIDTKERQVELNLKKTISKIDGFILGIQYMKQKHKPIYYSTNSIIDNQRQYNG